MKKKTGTIKKDHAAILLEGLRSDFKVFSENLDFVRERGNATFEAVGRLQEEMEIVKEDVSILKTNNKTLMSDMETVKEELHLIRNELKEKVGRDEFVFLESRVAKLEKMMRI